MKKYYFLLVFILLFLPKSLMAKDCDAPRLSALDFSLKIDDTTFFLASSDKRDLNYGISKVKEAIEYLNFIHDDIHSYNCTCEDVLYKFENLIFDVNKFFESKNAQELYPNIIKVQNSSYSLEIAIMACGRG